MMLIGRARGVPSVGGKYRDWEGEFLAR